MNLLTLFFLAFFAINAEAKTPTKKDFTLVQTLSTGEKMAYWSEFFIGTEYDKDPIGAYVRNNRIIYDTAVDCMYLTFRAAELSHAKSPEEAEKLALKFRFLKPQKEFIGYENRFEYGEDMAFSGLYGQNITEALGKTENFKGTRMHKSVRILPNSEVLQNISKFKTGDVIYLILNPEKRRGTDVIVGHLGVIKKEGNDVYLVHARGKKGGDKKTYVAKIPLQEYIKQNDGFFVGILATRF